MSHQYHKEYLESLASLDYVYLEEISFGTVTPQTISELGAFEVKYNTMEQKTRTPLDLYEEYFGPEDSSRVCQKCQAKECQGHFGYIKFPETENFGQMMVYNPLFLPIVKNIFSVICLTCSKLAVDKNDPRVRKRLDEILMMPRSSRLAAMKLLVGSSHSKFTECVGHVKKGDTILRCPVKKRLTPSSKTELSAEIVQAHEKRYSKKSTQNELSDLTDDTDTSRKKSAIGIKSPGLITTIRARLVYDMFQYIGGTTGHTEDCEYIGITKEEMKGYFQDSMLMIPTKFRPKKAAGKGNPLTLSYTNIIKLCMDFKANENKENSAIVSFQSKLQEEIAKYHKELNKLIGSKKGIVRNNLYGKRPGFAARTVIIPSRWSVLNVQEIPEVVAAEALNKEMNVTEQNIEALQELCFAGKISNIRGISRKEGGKIVPMQADNVTDNARHILEVGDTVWRHLQDGDIVGTGRQPTMNTQNLYAVYAKIVKGNVTGININCTTGTAADFDGDTFYMFVTQMQEALADMEKMKIGMHVRSRQKNSPIYGLTYDAIIAASLLTFTKLTVSESLYNTCTANYASTILNLDARLAKHGVDKYSGRGLFSTTLPPDFFYTGGKGFKRVEIKDGILISGMLSASTVSYSTGSIVDKMSIQYQDRWEVTYNFINAATSMLADFIDAYGYSVSFTDCMFGQNKGVSAKLEQKMEEAEEAILRLRRPETHYEKIKYEKDVQSIINGLKSIAVDINIFSVDEKEKDLLDRMAKYVDPDPKQTLKEQSIDVQITGDNKSALNSLCFLIKYYEELLKKTKVNPHLELHIRKTIEEAKNNPLNIVVIIDELSKRLSYADMYIDVEMSENSLIFMSKFISGAKGGDGNLTSIGVMLGHQQLMGMRLPQTVTGGSRMLITQRPDSLLLESRGFIQGSYVSGMTPNETFALASSVREGMASTATITKNIGNMQRQLDKALEHIKVVQGCPIFHENVVLNFSYGGDSMDGLGLLEVDNSYQCADLYQIVQGINSFYAED
jgi:DNA-directed RNA polymerase beta' subunit